MTLAERCYESHRAGDELFEKVNLILGVNPENCLEENFVWGAWDVQWDDYDCSVEVIRPNGAEFMTREQADQILALGFEGIYESCGEKALQWTKTGCGPVSSREPDEKLRLKAEISLLREDNFRLNQMLCNCCPSVIAAPSL